MENIKFAACFFAILTAAAGPACAQPGAAEANAANRLLKQGKVEESIAGYEKALGKAASPVIEYDLGTALYKKGDYKDSVEHLDKAAGSKVKGLDGAAFYNLGGALFKRGLSQEKQNIDGAIADLQRSMHNYDETLKINAKDEDARYNKDAAKKELERLQKKKQQRQQQQQKQEQQQQQQKRQKGASKPQDSQPQKTPGQQGDQQKQQLPQDSGRQKQNEQKSGKDSSGQPQGQPQGRANADEMTKQEAKDVLDDYQRNEAPKGLLNFVPRQGSDTPVAKDW